MRWEGHKLKAHITYRMSSGPTLLTYQDPSSKWREKRRAGMSLGEESPICETLAGWNRRAAESRPAWALNITKTELSFLLKIYIINQRKSQLAFIILLLLIISICIHSFICSDRDWTQDLYTLGRSELLWAPSMTFRLLCLLAGTLGTVPCLQMLSIYWFKLQLTFLFSIFSHLSPLTGVG